jgi:hypothetical protein
VLPCQLAMLKFMAHRGLFVATVGIPLAKCNNGNNKCNTSSINQKIAQMPCHASGMYGK